MKITMKSSSDKNLFYHLAPSLSFWNRSSIPGMGTKAFNDFFPSIFLNFNARAEPSVGINGNGCTGSIEIGVNIGSISSLKCFFRFFLNLIFNLLGVIWIIFSVFNSLTSFLKVVSWSLNIFADALDIDFGKSKFNNIECYNIKNDCLDISGAQINGSELFTLDTND